jgi:hypothetical protein
MKNEVAEKKNFEVDGFDSYPDESEGAGADILSSSRGVIQGTKLVFNQSCVWDPSITDELIAADVGRYVQKRPVDVIALAPGERFPDIAAMNDKTPRSEWRVDFNGNPCGPWQGTNCVYFINPATMEKFTWPSPITTIGSAICVRDLVDRIQLMGRYRGAHVYPVVELSRTFMPTRFGGRDRPQLVIKRWIMFGPGGGALPAPDTPSLTGPAAEEPPAAAKPASTKAEFLEVKPPSRQEELSDSIPW